MNRLRLSLLLVALAVRCTWADPSGSATVVVSSTPPGATVLLDQKPVGKTPYTVTVAPGDHVLRLSVDDNYEPVEQTVSLQAGDNKPVSVLLQRTAASYYTEALGQLQQGHPSDALSLMETASGAPGTRPPDMDFYRGILLEDKGDLPHAEQALSAYVSVQKASAVAHYHLARVQQAQGEASMAEYRTAILRSVKVAEAVMAATGPATTDRLGELRVEASAAGAEGSKLQLAYLLEQTADPGASCDVYRSVFETLAARQKVNLRKPDPITLTMTLPDIMTQVTPATPSNTMYVLTADGKKLSTAWGQVCKGHPELTGKVVVSEPEGGWTVVQAQAFDRQNVDDVGKLGLALSQVLGTDVVFLQVSRPATAWYWYWSAGHLLDRYCSNPGHPGEVDYRTIRQWAGRPDVMVKACHGLPASKLSGGHVTITDLNSVLYFYYPEMQSERPASWRSPGAVMKLLVQFLGAHDAPSRFGDRSGTFKPLQAAREPAAKGHPATL